MCGRYSLRSPRKRLAEHFGLKEEPEISPRYNIAPTQLVLIIRQAPDSRDRRPDMVRWGLIPFWAKEAKIGNRLINARAESVSRKPAFWAAWKHRRCLIPADAFYEFMWTCQVWKRIYGKMPKRLQKLITRGYSYKWAALLGPLTQYDQSVQNWIAVRWRNSAEERRRGIWFGGLLRGNGPINRGA